MAETAVLSLKELFQAAQQNDFTVVGEHLQRALETESNGGGVRGLVEPKTKNSLLHYACDNGNLDACKFLLMCNGMADAFLNEINAFGHTPLFYAASSGSLPLVKWLISNGADIDTDYSERSDIVPRDGDQGIFTALQIACFKGHEGVANFLIECNAELSGTRRNGKTALHFASAENHPAIVKILVEAGADVHACDDQGKTPVDVAPSSILPLLLPSQYPDQQNADDEDAELDQGGTADADDDNDDSFTTEDYEQLAIMKNAFGADVVKAFRSSSWKQRTHAISEANLCFQSAQTVKNPIKFFDAACVMIERALHDAVSQVVSICCTTLLKSAFAAAMGDKSFHNAQFHTDRPCIQRIAASLMSRGAGSNEKDSSEAVASLLFLICKSADLTRYITFQISQMFASAVSDAAIATSPLKTSGNDGQGASLSNGASWRHQLVAIKVLNAIASQYRLEEASSGLNFAGAVKVSLQGLENSSVHVRTAAIDLLVQSVLIRCEQSEMTGTADQIYEQMKSWTESIFKQQNQTLKPSIQAKINTGLRSALQQSKRLTSSQTEGSAAEQPMLSLKSLSNPSGGKTGGFVDPAAALSPRSKSIQKEEELPYAEPIAESQREEVVYIVGCFGEKATRCLLSNAWAPRVEGLSYVQYLIESRLLSFEKKPGADSRTLIHAMQTVLMQALQDRVNSVFEAGVSLLMEVAISFNNAFDRGSDVSTVHDFIRPLIPRLLAKLGDSKSRLHVTTEDALLLLSRQYASIGPEMLLEEMIACDRNASPQALSATYVANKLALISKLLLEFGVKENSQDGEQQYSLPIKNVLQPAIQACEHRDQNVRQVALQIIADSLQAARSAAMPFLDALARSARQKLISRLVEKGALEVDMLMEEVDDFEVSSDPSARPGTSGGIRPPTASGSSTKHRPALANTSLSSGSNSSMSGGSGNQSASAAAPLPYGTALTSEQKEAFATIIQGFGEEIVRCLLDKAWAQREAAVREIERQVVCCANGKIPAEQALPKTLETLRNLAHVLELGLNDTVARVFQCSLRLFQIIATDFLPLISSSHEFVDEILENVVGLVLQKLGDTKQRIRQDCFTLLRSMASLSHIGYARMCKMLSEKYQQLVLSSPSVASSAVINGELLKLLTTLVKEAHAVSSQARPDMNLILGIVGPALDNKHVDVRNAAVATYAAIFEVTSGGSDETYGQVDLNGLLAQAKPAIRDAISRTVVQIKKTLPSGGDPGYEGDGSSSTRPEVDSARRQTVTIDTHKLAAVCSSEITELLISSSSAQRCEGTDKLVALFISSPQKPSLKGAWEICCLLAKQLMADAAISVCLAAFEIVRLLVDPPGNGAVTAEYAIPWGEWGVHLVLGSTVRSIVQQSASESVRVRSQVKSLLQLIASRHAVGKNAVCNALLSAPEQKDTLGAPAATPERKIEVAKLRWQFMMRLELLHEYLLEHFRLEDAIATADLGRRRSGSTTNSSSKQSTDSLSVENLIPFLGSAIAHPSPTVRMTAHKIMQQLKTSREAEVVKFVQTGCSPALQKRIQLLLSEDFGGISTVSDGNEGSNVIRGSRASHVRRIAALRPPRSVPVEEKELMADVFPPPQSAPGNSRRSSGANHQDQDDDDIFVSKNDNYVVTASRDKGAHDGGHQNQQQQQQQQVQKVPIWLDQSATSSSSKKGVLSFGDGDSDSVVGGGTVGLMKMRRKSGMRAGGNNSGNVDDMLSSRQGIY